MQACGRHPAAGGFPHPHPHPAAAPVWLRPPPGAPPARCRYRARPGRCPGVVGGSRGHGGGGAAAAAAAAMGFGGPGAGRGAAAAPPQGEVGEGAAAPRAPCSLASPPLSPPAPPFIPAAPLYLPSSPPFCMLALFPAAHPLLAWRRRDHRVKRSGRRPP